MLEEIINIIQKSHLDEIYLIGFVDFEDGELAEFVANSDYLIFEFGKHFVKIQSVEQYSKISISKVSTIQINIGLEDVKPAKSRISGIIFNNPLIDNNVTEMEFYNLQINNSELICDAITFILSNSQELFVDPSFLGINIGGAAVKKLWEDNRDNNYVFNTTSVKF